MKIRIASSIVLMASLTSGCVDYEVCTTHYKAGPAMSVRYYKHQRPHRPWVIWTEDKRERLQTFYDHGQRTGTWHTEAHNGTQVFVREYQQDLPSGTWQRFYTDGSPQQQGSFERGLKTGTWRKWLPTGELIEEAEFSDGVFDGKVRRWSATGQLEFEGLFARGSRVGN